MGVNEELYAKSLEDLVAFEQAAAHQGLKGLAQQVPLAPVYGDESWAVTPLGQGFLLVNRDHRHVPAAVLKKIQHLLEAVRPNRDHDETLNLN